MRLLLTLLALVSLATADFDFFQHVFGGGGGGGDSGHHHHQQSHNPSDASLYHNYYTRSSCEKDRFLCPDSFACVHFAHHCPCVWDANEDKFELADGKRICVSKGGFKAGEAARKVELARKGLL